MTSLKNEAGFSLVESLVALGILAFGMMALATGFLYGTMQLTGSDLDIVAREKAAEAIESVFTARDTRTIRWTQIRNVTGVGGNGGGVFVDGPLALRRPGNDGLVNTADDSAELEALIKPGPDGQLGTADDIRMELAQFTRQVIIRDVSSTLRELQVIVRYTVGSMTREYQITTLISSYA